MLKIKRKFFSGIISLKPLSSLRNEIRWCPWLDVSNYVHWYLQGSQTFYDCNLINLHWLAEKATGSSWKLLYVVGTFHNPNLNRNIRRLSNNKMQTTNFTITISTLLQRFIRISFWLAPMATSLRPTPRTNLRKCLASSFWYVCGLCAKTGYLSGRSYNCNMGSKTNLPNGGLVYRILAFDVRINVLYACSTCCSSDTWDSWDHKSEEKACAPNRLPRDHDFSTLKQDECEDETLKTQ